jgi:hypothetical protein
MRLGIGLHYFTPGLSIIFPKVNDGEGEDPGFVRGDKNPGPVSLDRGGPEETRFCRVFDAPFILLHCQDH